MEIFDAKNAPFLLTTEAFEIYSQCMCQPTFDEYKNELMELASKPEISIFVCTYQQENAGIIVLSARPGNSAEILGIAVKDKLKRLGIGKFMINSAAAVLVEGVLIFLNSFLKLKTVADNAENVSRCVKSKIENGFHLKRNVCIFRRNKSSTEKQSHRRHLFISFVKV
ncbi:MAG: GNAT family N-acetyltransferase [Lentisphaeria bacterium]|nr:GNAT family N-acetyltransferase [Lentisphaeria bacterium]